MQPLLHHVPCDRFLCRRKYSRIESHKCQGSDQEKDSAPLASILSLLYRGNLPFLEPRNCLIQKKTCLDYTVTCTVKGTCKYFWCSKILLKSRSVLKCHVGILSFIPAWVRDPQLLSMCSVLTLGIELAWRSHWCRKLRQGRQCNLPLCHFPAWYCKFLQGRGIACPSMCLSKKRGESS